MGFIEVPDWYYEELLQKQIAAFEGMGFPPSEARFEALKRMGRGIVCRSGAQQRDYQKDVDEYREEMSLGGESYDPFKWGG